MCVCALLFLPGRQLGHFQWRRPKPCRDERWGKRGRRREMEGNGVLRPHTTLLVRRTGLPWLICVQISDQTDVWWLCLVKECAVQGSKLGRMFTYYWIHKLYICVFTCVEIMYVFIVTLSYHLHLKFLLHRRTLFSFHLSTSLLTAYITYITCITYIHTHIHTHTHTHIHA